MRADRGPKRWRFLTLLVGSIGLRCGGATAPEAAPEPETEAAPEPETEAAPEPAPCPMSWTEPGPKGKVIPFNTPPPARPTVTIASTPYGMFVQGTDGVQGIPDAAYGEMISRRFPEGTLVLLGKQNDIGANGDYFKAIDSLDPGVKLGLTLDPTKTGFPSVVDQLRGLAEFQAMLKTASGDSRSISTLVYQKDGGHLSDPEILALDKSLQKLAGPAVSLATFGSIGGASPAPPPGWTGPFTTVVETYGMFSHDCPDKEPPQPEQILVDGPAGGQSICSQTWCECTPEGTQSIYELCKDEPEQAGRIAGYLASLKAVPVDGSLDGVVFAFSFEPSTDDPTLSPAGWSPSDYARFADAFAEMVAYYARPAVTTGAITMGAWDMTQQYVIDNGWP